MAPTLTGTWMGPEGTVAVLDYTLSGRVTARPGNDACALHWTTGEGSFNGVSIDMTFTGGPASGNYHGRVKADWTVIEWSNGFSWSRS